MPLPQSIPQSMRPARFPARIALTLGLMVALAGCGAPLPAPRLLSQAEIAQASQGSGAMPDEAALLARAAGLSARAQRLRRTSIDQHEQRRTQERAQRLAAL